MSLDALVNMSNRYGGNEEYVVNTGGNTSFKDGEIIYIKASGTPLADACAADFVKMNLQQLIYIMGYAFPGSMSYNDAEELSYKMMLTSKEPGQEDKRPSVESILHALFPYSYVLHLHPAIINGLNCSIGFKETFDKLFRIDRNGGSDDPIAVCVEAVPPGPGLAKLCKNTFETSISYYCNADGPKCTDECRQRCKVFPQIAFLQNHGLFVSADTVGEIDDIMTYIIDKLTASIIEYPDFTEEKSDTAGAQDLKPLIAKLCKGGRDIIPEVCFYTNKSIMPITESKETFEPYKSPLTPEQATGYFNEVLFSENGNDDITVAVENYIERHGFPPSVIAIRNLGIYAVGDDSEKAQNTMELFKDAVKIVIYSKSFGGVNPLPEMIVNTMLNFNPYA